MLLAYAVRSVYIESCSMFVRGGVYRVVKEAMGSTLAKFSVSALMFDYILTGPISGVSAGLYLVGLLNELLRYFHVRYVLPANATAAFFAVLVTLYFWWENIKGVPESIFGGMLGVTGFGLVFTPAFYTLVQRIGIARSRASFNLREPQRQGYEGQRAAMVVTRPRAGH